MASDTRLEELPDAGHIAQRPSGRSDWVLILRGSYTTEPPAVIGGYPTRDAAEAAGDCALVQVPPTELSPWPARPHYRYYIVIPGAASAGAIGMVECALVDQGGGYSTPLKREKRRLPEDLSNG